MATDASPCPDPEARHRVRPAAQGNEDAPPSPAPPMLCSATPPWRRRGRRSVEGWEWEWRRDLGFPPGSHAGATREGRGGKTRLRNGHSRTSY
jgi:hypothetical protein